MKEKTKTDQNRPGSLFILVDNRNNHVVKAKYVPANPDPITIKINSVFETLNPAYEKFKINCIEDESLSNIIKASFIRIDISKTNGYALSDSMTARYVEEHLCSLNQYKSDTSHIELERKKWAWKIYKNEVLPVLKKDFTKYPDFVRKYSQYPAMTNFILSCYLHHRNNDDLTEQNFLRELRLTKLYSLYHTAEKCDPCKLDEVIRLDKIISLIHHENERYFELQYLFEAQAGTFIETQKVRIEIIVKEMELLSDYYFKNPPYLLSIDKDIKKNLYLFWNDKHISTGLLEDNLTQQLQLFIKLSELQIKDYFHRQKSIHTLSMELAELQLIRLNECYKQDGCSPIFQKRLQTLKSFISHISEDYSEKQSKLYNSFQEVSDKITNPDNKEKFILFGLENKNEAKTHIEQLANLVEDEKTTYLFCGFNNPNSLGFTNLPFPKDIVIKDIVSTTIKTEFKYPLFHLTFKVDAGVFKSNRDKVDSFCKDYLRQICNKIVPFFVYAIHEDQMTEIRIVGSNISDHRHPILTPFSSFKIEKTMEKSMRKHRLPILSYHPKQQIKENLNEFLINRPDRLLNPHLPPKNKGIQN